MLPHAIYFETLASIEDETSPEWRATVAGLVVLRLLDDWLDFGPHVTCTDVSGLTGVRDAIESVPEGNPVRGLLGRLVDTMVSLEEASVQAITAPVFAYAQALQYEGQFLLEKEVLSTLQKYAKAVQDTETVVITSLRIGIIWRGLGELTLAEESHVAAERDARSINDTVNGWRARIGLAKTAAIRGNLPLAESIVAAVAGEAERTGPSWIFGHTLHERAYLAVLRGNNQSAVRLAYQALEYMNSEGDRDRVMADLAAAFVRIGHLSAARDTNLILASCAQEQTVRWQATINLMHAAAKEWQEAAFDLYHATLELVQLPPHAEIFYHRAAAEGFRIFGRVDKAEQALQQAYQLAEKYKMQQLVFELEEELASKPVETWTPDIDSIADAIGERLRLQAHTIA